MNVPSAAGAALNAFLRGVERRGAVFAELQGGDADTGDAALAATLRGFREVAGTIPFADWPRRFWAMLLGAPGLRTPARVATLGDAFGHLVGLGSGPRAALLLRLVAGLAEADAAAVLGIARPTYRLALQRALPHRDDGSPDPDAWRRLSEAAQARIRSLPDERLERIVALRDGLRVRAPRAIEAAVAPESRPRWLWPATLGVVMLTAAALAATWWPFAWTGGGDPQSPRIQSQPLPPAAEPVARFDPSTALQTHRDLDLLLAQATGDFDDRADPAFDAWLVEALASPEAQTPPLPASTDAAESMPEQFDEPR